ncbi:MAG: transglutaminase domain-containing protein [Bacteroidales bacterium]|nr:transglutaminase domain-containing protein [Bacteroidales bacterium]
MKRIILLALAGVALMGGLALCSSGTHFIKDSALREKVHSTFEARFNADDGILRQFYQVQDGAVDGIAMTQEEQEALEFLYAYMPLADVTDYPTSYYLQNIKASAKAKEEMEWGKKIPDLEFRHFVLPIRVNNEDLDSSRVVFYKDLKPRVQGLSMKEAILEVNHWCHEKVTYQPSDARTSSPLNTVKNALGRCGEESTFTVAALRSVGIPARQVYTPRWAHTDDNHAWVEAWADGQWYFIGACEPEPVLNLGWFNQPASRGMLMHTKAFGHYEGPEEVVLEGPNYTEINLIDNYAKTGRADLLVTDEAGAPVEGACVDFCIYNYAEFYPAVKKYTDADGKTFLTAGLGDMLAWASKDGKYGCARVRFGADETVTIVLSENAPSESLDLDIVPPAGHDNVPEVTPELRAANDKRFAQEDSLRHAYEATFAPKDANRFVQMARGNHKVIADFLEKHPGERAEELLKGLSWKDLHDVTLDVLEDHFNATESVLKPRVANEFLTPYKGWFLNTLADEQKAQLSDPDALIAWTKENIKLLDDPTAWRIPMSPAGVFKARQADAASRAVFFVSLARTLGTESRIDPVTHKVQYSKDGLWIDVDFNADVQKSAPQGLLRLNYKPNKLVENPAYYGHFSISRIGDDGRTALLTFDEGQVDMGGGVSWKNVFAKGCPMDEGNYVLVSGNRLSDGSVPVTMKFFTIKQGTATDVELVIRESSDGVSVIGGFDAETPVEINESLVSILSQTGRGFYALGLLEVGKEPTNHALADIARSREAFEKWGRPTVLVCQDRNQLGQLKAEIEEGRYGQLPSNIILVIDHEGAVAKELQKELKTNIGNKPVFIVADTFNKAYFLSEGYTIGLGEQIQTVIKKLD